MTAYAIRASAPSPGRFLFPVLLAALLMALFGGIILNDHAVERHGEDAVKIRKCLDDKGPKYIYFSAPQNLYFLICQLGSSDKYGMQIVEWSVKAKAWEEVTSYIIKDGRLANYVAKLTGQEMAKIWRGAWPPLP